MYVPSLKIPEKIRFKNPLTSNNWKFLIEQRLRVIICRVLIFVQLAIFNFAKIGRFVCLTICRKFLFLKKGRYCCYIIKGLSALSFINLSIINISMIIWSLHFPQLVQRNLDFLKIGSLGSLLTKSEFCIILNFVPQLLIFKNGKLVRGGPTT